MQQNVFVKSIVFGEIVKKADQQNLSADIEWTDGFKKTKVVWCGETDTPQDEAEQIARERVWAYATTIPLEDR